MARERDWPAQTMANGYVGRVAGITTRLYRCRCSPDSVLENSDPDITRDYLAKGQDTPAAAKHARLGCRAANSAAINAPVCRPSTMTGGACNAMSRLAIASAKSAMPGSLLCK